MSKWRYCSRPACDRRIFPPNLYCDKHRDESSTPMTQQDNISKDLDGVLRKLRNSLEDDFKADLHFEEAKAALTTLITLREQEARIDELTKFPFVYPDEAYIAYKKKRLAELKLKVKD